MKLVQVTRLFIWIKTSSKKTRHKNRSAGFDPISKLDEIPNNPKQRYELMTKDVPKGGSLSLDMMYRTCGTQLNIDYESEKDFIKKFKVVNSLYLFQLHYLPTLQLSKKKIVVICLIDQKYGKILAEAVFLQFFLRIWILKNMQIMQCQYQCYSYLIKINIFQ